MQIIGQTLDGGVLHLFGQGLAHSDTTIFSPKHPEKGKYEILRSELSFRSIRHF